MGGVDWYFDRAGRPMTRDAWAEAITSGRGKRVALTNCGSAGTVSTVWTGLDLGFARAAGPVIFETLIFGGPLDGYGDRYSTEAAALAGHRFHVLWLQTVAGLPGRPRRQRPGPRRAPVRRPELIHNGRR